ncbi:hypothetical protein Anapl_09228 [Anas platyrhynchos]|uniref:Uncharacterized protein n=1 Tax=Anas platyrhynchos TaxID=8839 RepID=R0KDM0_ANAPL|nr:hypothetical protein Anapl_09228 [Anas platyrhynchos]
MGEWGKEKKKTFTSHVAGDMHDGEDVLCTLSGLVEHLRPPDSEEQKRGLPPAQDCVGQSCKPNMPWFMEPLFARVATSFSMRRVHGALSTLLFLLLLH